jgi:hypothetical protein
MRLGRILLMLRETWDMIVNSVIRRVSEAMKEDGDQGSAKSRMIAPATFSSYELGTRTPSEESLSDLKKIIVTLLHNPPFIHPGFPYSRDSLGILEPYIDHVHVQERALRALEDYLPLQYIGAMVLAVFLHDPAEIQTTQPFPDDYFTRDDNLPISYLLYEWLDPRLKLDFRVNFAQSLLFESFISKRIAGTLSIMEAEKYFRTADIKDTSGYSNSKRFCAAVFGEGLYFTNKAPAIEAIMSLSQKIQYLTETGQLLITVYTSTGGTRTIKFPDFQSKDAKGIAIVSKNPDEEEEDG